MRYYFTEKGLEPITCSTEELFHSLCTDLSTSNKYISRAYSIVESLLDDDTTVFRKYTDMPSEIDTIISNMGRIILKATLTFDDYRPHEKDSSGRIINRIEYQRGYQGYSADLWMIQASHLDILARKAIIDDMLTELQMSE